jgi:hypothetical protein
MTERHKPKPKCAQCGGRGYWRLETTTHEGNLVSGDVPCQCTDKKAPKRRKSPILHWEYSGSTSYPPYPGDKCANVYECQVLGAQRFDEGPGTRAKFFLGEIRCTEKDIKNKLLNYPCPHCGRG